MPRLLFSVKSKSKDQGRCLSFVDTDSEYTDIVPLAIVSFHPETLVFQMEGTEVRYRSSA